MHKPIFPFLLFAPIIGGFLGSSTVPVAHVGVSPTDSSFSPFTIHHSPFPDHLLGEAGSLSLMIRV
jgi:hypothetical protein